MATFLNPEQLAALQSKAISLGLNPSIDPQSLTEGFSNDPNLLGAERLANICAKTGVLTCLGAGQYDLRLGRGAKATTMKISTIFFTDGEEIYAVASSNWSRPAYQSDGTRLELVRDQPVVGREYKFNAVSGFSDAFERNASEKPQVRKATPEEIAEGRPFRVNKDGDRIILSAATFAIIREVAAESASADS